MYFSCICFTARLGRRLIIPNTEDYADEPNNREDSRIVLEANIIVFNPDNDDHFSGSLKNLSSKGVCFASKCPATEGRYLDVTVAFPSGDGAPLRAKARVVRVRDIGGDSDPEIADLLKTY